jgi:hypothetical protein
MDWIMGIPQEWRECATTVVHMQEAAGVLAKQLKVKPEVAYDWLARERHVVVLMSVFLSQCPRG